MEIVFCNGLRMLGLIAMHATRHAQFARHPFEHFAKWLQRFESFSERLSPLSPTVKSSSLHRPLAICCIPVVRKVPNPVT